MYTEYIVVGSGPSGAQAAQTLVEAGCAVSMLDTGCRDVQQYEALIPPESFVSIRRSSENQHRFFIGDDFEALHSDNITTGAQLTPPRQYIRDLVDELTPLHSENFHPMESLAYGGLGNAWGLGCCVFSDKELQMAGLSQARMYDAYATVARRIGIAAANDDARKYTIGPVTNHMKALRPDTNAAHIYSAYRRHRKKLNEMGFFLGQPALALLSEDHGERKATAYADMDFYTDQGLSAYRPKITVEELKKKANFTYRGNLLALRYRKNGEATELTALNTITRREETYSCKKLILACGTLGTARIVLRSENAYNTRLPVLSNPYIYVACVQPALLGKEIESRKTSMAQLVLFHDEDRTHSDVVMCSLYSYSSLMLFRLLRSTPLGFRDGRLLHQYLHSGLVIAGIHFPEQGGDTKYLELAKDNHRPTGDTLAVSYSLSAQEKETIGRKKKKMIRALRRLSCYAIKTIDPGHGSSIHYAGTMPFSEKQEKLRLSPKGRLYSDSPVYVADGSGFRYLPAKGLTFSLMANAHVVAQHAMND